MAFVIFSLIGLHLTRLMMGSRPLPPRSEGGARKFAKHGDAAIRA